MSDAMLKLIEPTESLRAEFEAFRAEFGGDGYIHGLGGMTGEFEAALRNCRDHARGVNLPAGYVAASTFWLVRDGRAIVGTSNLRHELTPFLLREGGHIGYSIRPSEQRKGYGTRLLAMTLGRARAIGLTRVLVTCAKGNIGSAGVIRGNGGVLEDEVQSVLHPGEMAQRYWIEL
ncbi:MAG: GNAT family N-acetyltransferase [Phycisphaerae bacterium]|nr:GNAT family N-acetyltransferase [Phycisphaerae bacterium]